MSAAPRHFNVFTQKFESGAQYPEVDPHEVLKANTAGITINSVSGTAIAGVRTDGDTFTRSSGVWIKKVIIGISSVSGTFVDGETVTETTSSATGVIEEVSDSVMILNTITAEFTGSETLTGGTSSATATGDASPVNVIDDLAGKLLWSHPSGTTTTGVWVRGISNTKSAVDVDGTLEATGTAVIIVDDENAARAAMDIDCDADDFYSSMQVTSATAAAVALSESSGKHQLVIADTGSNNVAITLPDARLLKERTQIFFYGKDATTNAITVVGFNTAQTLDGTDIKTTPFADIDADDDYMIIELRNGVWVTTEDGIS